MLILSVKVPKRVHADGDNYERVVLQFPDGSEGVVHFFHTSGQHMKVGFEMPEAVGIRRGSILEDVPPENLAAFADGLSKLAEACRPIAEDMRIGCESIAAGRGLKLVAIDERSR